VGEALGQGCQVRCAGLFCPQTQRHACTQGLCCPCKHSRRLAASHVACTRHAALCSSEQSGLRMRLDELHATPSCRAACTTWWTRTARWTSAWCSRPRTATRS
jgi:hypothetical protein